MTCNNSSIPKNVISLDKIFPLKTSDALGTLEAKIKTDENFKTTLVN